MIEQRFWSKVDASGDCWLWLGSITANGYGQTSVGGRRQAAHRYAYEQTVGPIPNGLQLDHLCRVHACVNPDHLEPVTNRENVLRGVGTSAVNARKTHCIHGHPLSGDNLMVYGSWRKCRTCWLAVAERQRHSNQEAERLRHRWHTRQDARRKTYPCSRCEAERQAPR